MEITNRDLEYLVDDLINRLEDYFHDWCRPDIEYRIKEIKKVREGGSLSDYEQWVVSSRGEAIHLWTHLSGMSETLCGRPIRKDGYQVFYEDLNDAWLLTPCIRCFKWKV